MTKRAARGWFLALLLVCVTVGVTAAQEHGASSSSSSNATKPAPQGEPRAAQPQQPENPNAVIGGELAETSREAAGEEAHDEHAKFKYSKTVVWLGRHLGIGTEGMYWVSIVANFVLLGLFFYMLLRSKLPQMFRERTATIQKGIREARAASAEASRRLAEIEARLAKLDTEVGDIRGSAEREAAAEEERIRQAAEEDKRKVVEGAETEISAIARNARRELKSYAASLAVDLASRRIHVDEPTDQTLVREFVEQLGKDGK